MPKLFELVNADNTTAKDIEALIEERKQEKEKSLKENPRAGFAIYDWTGAGKAVIGESARSRLTISALHLAIVKRKFHLIPSILNFIRQFPMEVKAREASERRRAFTENCIHAALKYLSPEEAFSIVPQILRIHPDSRQLLNEDIRDKTKEDEESKEKGAIEGPLRPKNTLGLALEKGYTGLVKLFLEDPGFDINGQNSFYWAMRFNSKETIEMLLDMPGNRIDINRIELDDLTPLMRAISENNVALVARLLQDKRTKEHVNKINENLGQTALHIALKAREPNSAIIAHLLQQEATLDAPSDRLGRTPRDYATDKPIFNFIRDYENSVRAERAKDLKNKLAATLALKGQAAESSDYIKNMQAIRGIADRLQKTNQVVMDERLFAHINNDYKIKGKKLQGNIFANTARYAGICLKFFQDGALLHKIGGEEKSILERLINRFNAFGLIEKELAEMRSRGLTEIVAKKNAFELIKRKLTEMRHQGFRDMDAEEIARENFTRIQDDFIRKGGSSERLEEWDPEEDFLKPHREKMNEEIKIIQNKYLDEITKLILGQLEMSRKEGAGEGILIPGGWEVEPQGHAMVYGLSFDESGNIIFTLYNSGAGIQFHSKKERIDKSKYSPIMQFRIPVEQEKQLPLLLKNIMSAQTNPIWNKTGFDAKRMYETIFSSMALPGITLLPLPPSTPYIGGQRAGTCSWKSLMAVLKTSLPKRLYRFVKLQIKFQSILDFFVFAFEQGKLGEPSIKQELEDAIENINRMILKLKEKEFKQTGQKIEELQPMIQIFEFIEKALKQEECRATSITTNPTIASMVAYREIQKYSIEVLRSSWRESDLTRLRVPTVDEKAKYDYDVQFNNFFHSRPGGRDPILDFDGLANELEHFQHNIPESVFTSKRIEEFIARIPLDDAYWAALTPSQLQACLNKLCGFQRIYGEAIYKTNLEYAYESRLLVSYKIFALQIKLLERYFNDPAYGAVYLNFISEYLEIRGSILNKNEFVIANGQLAKMAEEVETFFMEDMEKYRKKKEAEAISWQSIASKNRFDYKTIQDVVDKEIQDFKMGHEAARIPLVEIENRNDYALWVGMKKARDLMDPQTVRDLDFFETYQIALHENQVLRRGSYLAFHSMTPNDSMTHSKLKYELQATEDAGNTGLYRAVIEHPRSRSLGHYQTGNIYSKGIESINNTTVLQDRFPLLTTDDENGIQTVFKDKLDAELDNNRLVLHTHVNKMSRVLTTLEYGLSNFHRFSDVAFQILVETNLFNTGILKETLDQNPRSVEYILKFIEEGVKYYTEENYVQFQTSYFFRLNSFLIDHLRSLPAKHEARRFLESACGIEKSITEKLNLNNPEIRKFHSEVEKEHAEVVQKSLHYNVLQKIEREVRYGLIEPTKVFEDYFADYLKACFYINQHDFEPTNPNERTPSIYFDIKNSLIVRFSPLMKQLFDHFSEKKRFEFCRSCLPQDSQFRKIIENASHVEYNFPLCTLVGSSGESVTFTLSEGRVSSLGMAEKAIPSSFYNFKYFKKLFGEKRRYGRVSLDGECVEFEEQNHTYRLINGEIYKSILINNVKHWFIYRDLEEDARHTEKLNETPLFLRDKNHHVWENVGVIGRRSGAFVFSNANTHQDETIFIDGGLHPLNTTGYYNTYDLVKLYSFVKSDERETPFDFLKRFEGSGFIEVLKKCVDNREKGASDIIIRLPRYGMEFYSETSPAKDVKDLKEKVGKEAPEISLSPVELVWRQDPRYCIDLSVKPDSINHFSTFIRLKPRDPNSGLKDRVIIPFQPFVAHGKEAFNLDRNGHYLEEQRFLAEGNVKNAGRGSDSGRQHSFEADQWRLKNSCEYLRCSITTDGKLEAETAEGYLYLAYLCIAQGQAKEAFEMFEQFKLRGGFTGSKFEARVLKWILSEIPYPLQSNGILKNEPQITAFQGGVAIATPELCALRANVLLALVRFEDSQNNFRIKNANDFSANEQAMKYENETLINFTGRRDSASHLELLSKTLTEYQNIKNNIPVSMRLRAMDHFFLYRTLSGRRLNVLKVEPSISDTYTQLKQVYDKVEERVFRSKLEDDDSKHAAKAQKTLEDSKAKRAGRNEETFVLDNIELTFPEIPLLSKKIEEIMKMLTRESSSAFKSSLEITRLTLLTSDEDFIRLFPMLLEHIRKEIREKRDIESDDMKAIREFTLFKIRGYFQNMVISDHILLESKNLIELLEVKIEAEKGGIKSDIATLILCLLLQQGLNDPKVFSEIANGPDAKGEKEGKEALDHPNFKGLFDWAIKFSEDNPLRLENIAFYNRQKIKEDKEELEEQYLPSLKALEVESFQPLELVMGFQQETIPVKQAIESFGLKASFETREKKTAEPTEKELFSGANVKDYREGTRKNGEIKSFNEYFIKEMGDPKKLIQLKNLIEKNASEAKSIISRFENQLIDFANQLPKDDHDKLLATVRRLGREHAHLQLKDILMLYLKRDRKYYREQTHLGEKEIDELYRLTTQFLVEATEYKHYQRILKDFERIKSLAPATDEFRKGVSKLGETLYAQRRRDYLKSRPSSFLVFEYYQDLLIKPEQERMLDALLTPASDTNAFSSRIIQLIMGGGKTTVVVPTFAYLKAQGNNLVSVIVSDALAETNFRDFAMSSKKLFNQTAHRFIFSRATDCSIENLTRIRDHLKSLILKKEYVVATCIDIQSIELKWLELLAVGREIEKARKIKSEIEKLSEEVNNGKKQWKKLKKEVEARLKAESEKTGIAQKEFSISNLTKKEREYFRALHNRNSERGRSLKIKNDWLASFRKRIPVVKENEWKNSILLLEEMLDIFKNRADVLIDEVDSNCAPKTELNFSVSDECALETNVIEDVLSIYFDIQEVDFSIGGNSYNIKNALEGKIPNLTEPEWKDLFEKEISDKIVKKLRETNDSPLFKIMQKLDKAQQEILSKYLQGTVATVPKFLNDLLTTEERETIGTHKAEIFDLLKLTLCKVANVNYGYPKRKSLSESEKMIAIPYLGNNKPSKRAKFDETLETANYTVQLNLINGVSKTVLKKFIEAFRNEAIRQKTSSTLYKTINETKAALEFRRITGITRNILTIDTESEDVLNEIHDRIKHTPEVVRFCLKNFILNNIKSSGSILRHNSQNHTSMYRSVQGISGTIQSAFLFDERMKFDADMALGTDGRTINYLLSKNTIVHKLGDQKLALEKKSKEKATVEVKITVESEQFKPIARLLELREDYRAFIDVGDYFRGIDNIKVAREIAKFYKERYKDSEVKPLKYVLFFNARNKLCALSVENPSAKPILIGSTNPKVIDERLECASAERFTYYDEIRATGTDIQQMPNAHALVTLSAHTTLKQFLQGCARMRDLAETHEIEVVVPTELSSASNDPNWNINRVLGLVQTNEITRIKEDNFHVAIQKMKNIIRNDLLSRIRRTKDFSEKERLYKAFDEVIHSRRSFSTFERFGDLEREDSTDKILREQMKINLEVWNRCLNQANIVPSQEEIATVQTAVAVVIHRAIPLCNPTEKITADNRDCQVQSVRETKVNKEVRAEALQEAHKEVFRQIQLQNQILGLREGYSAAKAQEDVVLTPINNLMVKFSKELQENQKPTFRFHEGLCLSQNFYRTCDKSNISLFDAYQKPIQFIQYVVRGKEWVANVITQQEAVTLRGREHEYQKKKKETFEKGKETAAEQEEPLSWIETPSGMLFQGTRPKGIESAEEYRVLTEQIQYINGDTRLLAARAINQTQSMWLSENSAQKLDFYERVILSCHPSKTAGFLDLRDTLRPPSAIAKDVKQRNTLKTRGWELVDSSSMPSKTFTPGFKHKVEETVELPVAAAAITERVVLVAALGASRQRYMEQRDLNNQRINPINDV